MVLGKVLACFCVSTMAGLFISPISNWSTHQSSPLGMSVWGAGREWGNEWEPSCQHSKEGDAIFPWDPTRPRMQLHIEHTPPLSRRCCGPVPPAPASAQWHAPAPLCMRYSVMRYRPGVRVMTGLAQSSWIIPQNRGGSNSPGPLPMPPDPHPLHQPSHPKEPTHL